MHKSSLAGPAGVLADEYIDWWRVHLHLANSAQAELFVNAFVIGTQGVHACHAAAACRGAGLSSCLGLQVLHDPLEELRELEKASGSRGCTYCGGLGHRIGDCPKLRSQNREQQRNKKDYFGSGGFGGET